MAEIPSALARYGLRVTCAICGAPDRWRPKHGGPRLVSMRCRECGRASLFKTAWAEEYPDKAGRRVRRLRVMHGLPVDPPTV